MGACLDQLRRDYGRGADTLWGGLKGAGKDTGAGGEVRKPAFAGGSIGLSGSWCVKTASHKVGGSGGYSTSLELESPAPTEAVKAESFTRVNEKVEEPDIIKLSSIINKLSSIENDNYQAIREKVKYSDDPYDRLIVCLPEIAAAEADKCWFEADKIGWMYLSQLLRKWLSIKRNENGTTIPEKIEPFWIEWSWLMLFFKAREHYRKFIHNEKYLFSENARALLWKRICESSFVDKNEFDFIENYRATWENWANNYFQRYTVNGFTLWPDGLFAALGAFTFRSLARGTFSKIENGHEIIVTNIAVFAQDIFNFEDNAFLGYWSCENLDFTFAPSDDSYLALGNDNFREFSGRHGVGANFPVLSLPHVVETFKRVRYVYP